jgi:hypothetical protein
MPAKKAAKLKYGEGQREQYGEGMAYRAEEKTKAADTTDHGFAGGERKEKPLPKPHKPADECR